MYANIMPNSLTGFSLTFAGFVEQKKQKPKKIAKVKRYKIGIGLPLPNIKILFKEHNIPKINVIIASKH